MLGRATRRCGEAVASHPLAATFGAATVVFGLESLAWPLVLGRDGTSYLMYFEDIASRDPLLPQLMLFRTPLAPAWFGTLLTLGGAVLAEFAMALLYAASITAFVAAGRLFGRRAAVGTAVALLLFVPYGALFHQVSSDAVFGATLALWVLLAARAAITPSVPRYAFAGAGIFAMTMARPSAQALILFGLVPLLGRRSWRDRLLYAGAFAGVAVSLLAGWAIHNGVRYGQYTVARGSAATVPFYRVFVVDHLVSPDNGPESRKLSGLVADRLLDEPVYRAAGVTTGQFFGAGGDRAWGDLVVLHDRVWGWDSNYRHLRRVALEAVRHRWRLYLWSVGSGIRVELTIPYRPPPARRPVVAAPAERARAAADDAQQAEIGGVLWWLASTPDGRIGQRDGRLVWPDSPKRQRRFARLQESVRDLEADLPNRNGSVRVASILNGVSRAYPWILLWIVVGIVGLAARRPVGGGILLALAAVCGAALSVTVASMPSMLEYGLPFDPVFILLGVGGLLARPAAARRAPAAPSANERVAGPLG